MSVTFLYHPLRVLALVGFILFTAGAPSVKKNRLLHMGGALANTSYKNPRSLAIEEMMGSHIAKHVFVINSRNSIKKTEGP